MDEKTYIACKAVVSYLYQDEQRNWEESGKPKNHIFYHVATLSHHLEEVAKDFEK